MCGIAGLIYYTPEQYKNLGFDLLSLIATLESRGPDSCGVALYTEPVPLGQVKLTLQGVTEQKEEIEEWANNYASIVNAASIGNGQRIILDLNRGNNFDLKEFKETFHKTFPKVHWTSIGQTLEIYKDTGTVENLAQNYDLRNFAGSHGIAHTRMATESAVDLNRCHPFTTSYDLSIVHNGQISNYYKLRFQLERAGIVFETNNDSELLAHYIYYQLLLGKSLDIVLRQLLDDIDGTYTFLVATPDKIALVRDKFAAKPAVIYESEKMVAIASEYRALLNLKDFDPNATIRELDGGEINIWSVVDSKIPV